jgi:hypothetical protein
MAIGHPIARASGIFIGLDEAFQETIILVVSL